MHRWTFSADVKERIADIALPGLPKPTLSYTVPGDLAETIRPGFRVLVPLGRRLVTGYCVRLHSETGGIRLKPVRALLDDEPSFSETHIRLAFWIHQYYACPLGDVLKAALPQGVDQESEEYVHLGTADLDRALTEAGASRKKRAILEVLSTGEYLPVSELAIAAGYKDVSRELRELESDGFVRVEAVVSPPKVSGKRVLAARLREPWTEGEKIRELMELLESRAPKQVNVISVLWQEYRAGRRIVPVAELVGMAQASSAQVRALEDKEIVAVELEEAIRTFETPFEEAPKEITLTRQQRSVAERVASEAAGRRFHSFLLHGVTASGKTQVYIEAIRRTVNAGRRAIVLVPEIALTPQLVSRFRAAFGRRVAVLHSRMARGERYDAWRMIRSGQYEVVIGVRSAVFAPAADVGLIVVDEEHDASYKQSDMQPRYHARDVAVVRARLEDAAVLLGSATPSCESIANARAGKYTLLSLPDRVAQFSPPAILSVDLSVARRQRTMRGSLSGELAGRIEDRLRKGEGIIILQNRRGFSPRLECRDCGFVPRCDNCSISLTYHKVSSQLRCHYCGAAHPMPDVCERCGGTELDMLGVGTQRVEEDLAEQFPSARILRMDLDTTARKGSHDAILLAFHEGEADVLVGTQMVSKGLDFPRVTLVGVIDADQSLLLPDFRAAERTFQLLTQVAGRSGRAERPGEVVIQTSQPEHPVIRAVLGHDFDGFIAREMEARKEFFYPPFSRLVLIEFSGLHEQDVASYAARFAHKMPRRTRLFLRHEPTPAAIARINRKYRYHLLLKVDKAEDPGGARLFDYLGEVEEQVTREKKPAGVRLVIDVDPQHLL